MLPAVAGPRGDLLDAQRRLQQQVFRLVHAQPAPHARGRVAEAERRGINPLARVLGYASFAREPEWFTTAPAGAIQKLLAQLGWKAGDAHLYEVNEAFAVVTMAAMRDVGFDHARTNVNGGACALGHPIGATGARIVATLVHALRARGGGRGIASLCIGGGEATAIAVEVPS